MAQAEHFGFGTQIRKSPYFDATVRWGAKGFSVYNHMYIPRSPGGSGAWGSHYGTLSAAVTQPVARKIMQRAMVAN